MNYTVTNAGIDDLNIIYQLFEEAILFQKDNNYIGWKNYDKEYIQADIQQGLLFKITSGDDVICIFSVCYADSLIWRAWEKNDAIYLHRIILNRAFKGEKIFKLVLEWAVIHAHQANLKFIRMDTWAENKKIIDYYISYGFVFVENYTTSNTND